MKPFSSRFLAALLLGLTLLSAGIMPQPPSLAASPRYEIAQIQARSVYQGSVNARGAILSPQAVLNKLKLANQVPKEVAPEIKVQESNTLNAATDGQNLIITSGLLEKLSTDDQLAFVISHELSHILLQHIGKTQARRLGLGLLDALVVRRYTAQGSLAQRATELGLGLVDSKSSRGYEYQADDLGVRLMSQAGYDPRAALKVFDILQAATPGNRTPEFLQDHPITQSRIKALVQKYKLSS